MTKTKNNNTSGRIPAVAYARYSSSGQNEASIEQQLRDIYAWAENNGFKIIGEYKDAARSGFKEASESQRPEFMRMIADAKKHSFKAVIVWKTDRFSRNRYDSAIYTKTLRDNGVRIYKVMDTNAEGKDAAILDAVMEGFAEYYSLNLSENVKRGLADNARKFKVYGKCPLGYTKDPVTGRFAIVPEEAEIVKRIFEEYASGKSNIDIITDLNAEGYKTKEGHDFNKCSIVKIIKNDRYIGVYTWKGVKTPGEIPAIIDQETFDRAQEKTKLHSHAPALKADTGFLLAGKLFCGECGSTMPGDSAKSKSGKIHYWYTCRNKRFGHTCENPRAKRDELENLVVDTLLSFISSDEVIEQAADQILEYQEKQKSLSNIQSLESHLSEAEKKLDNIMAAIENGAAIKKFMDRAAELENEIEDIKLQIEQKKLSLPTLSRDHVLYFFEKMRSIDPNNERSRSLLIEALLCKAFLYKDGKLVLILNTGNPREQDQLTLENIENEIHNAEDDSSNFELLPQLKASKSNTLINSLFVINGFYGIALESSKASV